jgi:DNA polymerase III delta subunit
MSAARGGGRKAGADPVGGAISLPDPLPRVIALAGDDELGKDELLSKLIAAAGPEAEVATWPIDSSRGPAEVTRIARDLATRSLFGGRKVILVRDGDALLKSGAAALPALLEPNAGNLLVLRFTKLDQRFVFGKRLKESGALFVLERPKLDHLDVDPSRGIGASALLASIVADGEARGLTIAPDAAHELALRLGNDRLALTQELAKFETRNPDRRDVTLRDVVELTPQSASLDLFRLFQEIATGDATLAMERVAGLLERGTLDRSGRRVIEPTALLLMTIAAIHQKLALLARYRDAARGGASREEIQKAIGVKNPGQMFFLSKEVRLPIVDRVEAATIALADADRAAKSSSVPEHVLTLLVGRLASLGRAAARARGATPGGATR